MTGPDINRFVEGWRIQIRVIHALMIRELNTRFGRENIGFLWIMAEPLLFSGLVAIIWRGMKGSEEHGISIIAFVVSGYIPITLFRHGVSRSIALFTANSSLLYHRQVKIVDFIIVRFLLEMIGGMMAYFFAACLLIIFGELPIPSDIGLFISGWLLYSFFCLSICLIIGPLSEVSEVFEKFIPVTTYIMIPFSGAFTMASWITPHLREYLLWSPFVHGMEMMRKGIWGEKVVAYYSIWVPIGCSIIFMIIGLLLCRSVRKNLAVA